MPLKTAMYDAHVRAQGKIVSYAGYFLPIQYDTGIIKEHMAVRNSVGLFDVSHMGEIIIRGKEAIDNIENLLPQSFEKLEIGKIRYSTMCNENGFIIDDLLVYKVEEEEYLLVVNAANRKKDFEHIQKVVFGEVEVTDVSEMISQVALQGKNSIRILEKLMEKDEIPTKYYSFIRDAKIGHISCLISKTGYTGEEGYEIYCNVAQGEELWNLLLQVGNEYGILPCGLGARDTLRLEAGMPLYGHEMNEHITPYDTGLDFSVKLQKDNFIGKEALRQQEKSKTRVGIQILGKGIAREGHDVICGGEKIGYITSGMKGPYLGYPIAMAIVDISNSEIGTNVSVMIRGKEIEAKIVSLPFYRGMI